MKRTELTQQRLALYALGALLAVRWVLMLAAGR